ncbi:MAG: hypothetical protein IKO34_03005 [Bacteroidales bacterium]|nr:hypothetical protein [Bacteroidales bacterium]
MFDEKSVKEYVSMLKKGASEETLKSTFFVGMMSGIASRYNDTQYYVYHSSFNKLKSFLTWQNIPQSDIVMKGDVLSVKFSNISVDITVRYYWRSYMLRFTATCLANYYVEVRCSEDKVYDFLMEANNVAPKVLQNFEIMKQEMEQMMKKTIADVILAREKKEKTRSVTITSIETLAKQKLMPYGIEKLGFEHKKIVSHVFAAFKDGKQQIDIAIKHNDLQKAIETIDNAGRVIEMIQKNDFVVRGKLGFGYDS